MQCFSTCSPEPVQLFNTSKIKTFLTDNYYTVSGAWLFTSLSFFSAPLQYKDTLAVCITNTTCTRDSLTTTFKLHHKYKQKFTRGQLLKP